MVQSGKAVVIVITIVFSCLSFTLGFFVGKFGTHNRPEVTAVATEPVMPAQNVQPQQLQSPLPAEALKTQPEPPGTTAPPQEIPDPKSGPTTSPKADPTSENGPGHEPARVARDAVATQVKEVSKTAVQENKQDSARQRHNSPDTLYAVQLGAFKNKAEAGKVKAKYSKKGYKIYIEAVKADRNMIIYKLRTGEFREKKDAEVLAVKLKKTENLKTFVVTVSK